MRTIVHKAVARLVAKGFFNGLNDVAFLKLAYWSGIGKRLNLKNPKSFNEKLQWLKLNDHNSRYIQMVDKKAVKKYVAEVIGQEYVVPTLGEWRTFDEIDWQSLPEQFVLKCTHDSGGLIICKDKSKLDMEMTRRKIEKSLNRNYYLQGREWPYKGVKPQIIAEKYMENADGTDLKDYKYFCFEGEPKLVLVCDNRFTNSGLTEDFYDMDWKHLSVERVRHKNSGYQIPQPNKHSEMARLAKELSKGTHFMRVDFYEIEDRVYFGEITFYPAGGIEGFVPDSWDSKLGEWINL